MGSIHLVPEHDLARLFSYLILGWLTFQPFQKTSSRTLARLRNKKDLEVRIGKDNCADIAAVDYHIIRFARLPHLIVHPLPHSDHPGYA